VSGLERTAAPAGERRPRPLRWSVRRELWENRSLWAGPLAVAGAVLLGFLATLHRLPERVLALAAFAPDAQYERVMFPFHAAAGIPIVGAFLVGAFYCLEALHGERRDRSILFWKSLPVSDRTTVLAKAAVPLVVLPAIVPPIVLVTQLVLLVASALVLWGTGSGLGEWWQRLPLFATWPAIAYSLMAASLWLAPVYAWLLLVSGWARRAPALWAVLPPLAAAAFERVAFGTSFVADLLEHRLVGWFTLGFDPRAPGSTPAEPLTHLTAGRLLAAPGLWLGLLFAAACLAAAVRLRRAREPL
jgi:ABC-2 type transport system permease protein